MPIDSILTTRCGQAIARMESRNPRREPEARGGYASWGIEPKVTGKGGRNPTRS